MNFEHFGFSPRIAAGISSCGYTTPTPIQEKAIPVVMQGHDVMGLAQTGTGKTAAFALPILNRLSENPNLTGKLRALVLAPTRELAEQIRESFVQFGGQTGLKTISVYGGVGIGGQIQALRKGVDVVVACPGRLLDHISQRTINLKDLEVVVLDEADMMLDMGFLPDIRRIFPHLPSRRQNLLFSATMPDAIRKLATDMLRQPVTVQVDRTAPAGTVAHALYPVPQHLKTALLLELLKHTDTDSVLVFTRTKHRAKRLGQQLLAKGYSAASLQGNLSQNARQAALNGFRDGKFNILVATDIAARGIDVSQVSHVINFDIPDTTEAYTHRIGRTGRALRNGDAFTLITDEDAAMVRSIEGALRKPIERRRLEGFDYKQAATKEASFARQPQPAQPGRRARKRQAQPGYNESRGSRSPHAPAPTAPRQDAPRRPFVTHHSASLAPIEPSQRPHRHPKPAGPGSSAGAPRSGRGDRPEGARPAGSRPDGPRNRSNRGFGNRRRGAADSGE